MLDRPRSIFTLLLIFLTCINSWRFHEDKHQLIYAPSLICGHELWGVIEKTSGGKELPPSGGWAHPYYSVRSLVNWE